MNKRSFSVIFILLLGNTFCLLSCYGQSEADKYNAWRKEVTTTYTSFRNECNNKYAQFLREAWETYRGEKKELPVEDDPIPPQPYIEEQDSTPVVERTPIEAPVYIPPIKDKPQPIPFEPIRETPVPRQDYATFEFYGIPFKIRAPFSTEKTLTNCTPNAIGDGWQSLSNDASVNNTIRDCLETRIKYDMCDWAYLQFINEMSAAACKDKNFATLLAAYIFCQSGYQMRLGRDESKLILLYGSEHTIFRKTCFKDGDKYFYPYGETSDKISMCNVPFERETPLSLLIQKEQKLGTEMSEQRSINSKRYYDMKIESQVPVELVRFFDTYPTSCLDNNPLTRWAMYANTPLSKNVQDKLYPSLIDTLQDRPQLDVANRLLNWVQTGFVYEYDDQVWGQDRAFFAEETLFYPYCDCEDRSILFSHLIRDLLGIDVALVYYPGHLATAVCFDDEVEGETLIINNRKFTICDPTYIGAPVGAQMPGLKLSETETILLNR